MHISMLAGRRQAHFAHGKQIDLRAVHLPWRFAETHNGSGNRSNVTGVGYRKA